MIEWTEERVARLKELWALEYSAQRIGLLIGTTKNSVISKSRKIGLPRRQSPINRTGSRLNRGQSPERIRNQWLGNHGRRRVVPISLRFKTCQWIEGQPTPDDSCKCGAPVVMGEPYCAAHLRQAWVRR